MSFIEQVKTETIARRRRFYGDEINYCERPKLSYSGVAVGKMWLGLDPCFELASNTRRAVDIIRAVLAVTHVERNDFLSARRAMAVCEARQLACFFMRHHTKLSFPQIGSFIGGKDHTTVMHAVRTVQKNSNGRFSRRLCAISLALGLLPPACG